jgi:hypothetical protein
MIWPFKPKQPRLSMEEYAAQQPPAPCGEQTIHYEWNHFESMGCPCCAAIRKQREKNAELDALADKIVARLQAHVSGVTGAAKADVLKKDADDR